MKKIGIPAWSLGENSFGVTKPYLNWLSQFGEIHMLMPSTTIREDLDLVILPGGADLAPQSYGEAPGLFTGNTDVYKQYFFDVNLPQYIAAGTPIFGICLGFQQLCAHFGGKLIQDFPYDYSSKHRGELVDTLNFETRYANNANKPYKVNSLHHQGCNELPEGCEVIARSQDKNIEIAKFAENIYGMQYHPEEINDPIAKVLIYELLGE